jgi:hypothetical protein
LTANKKFEELDRISDAVSGAEQPEQSQVRRGLDGFPRLRDEIPPMPWCSP